MDPPQEYPLQRLFGRVLSPFEQFLRRTSAGGVVLIGTTAIALSVATVFGADTIHRFVDPKLALAAEGRFSIGLSLHEWINDGLMALFFLLVGLELKREILVGELSSLKDAALPVVAAAGGMLVPALIYASLNAGTPGAPGWGISMATDIAFAVGILVLLAWRVPKNLIVFLMALAIADDLGAVLVIGIFYSSDINVHALLASAALFVVLIVLNRGGVRHPLPYWLIGVLLWIAIHDSGVHATLAGVLLAAAVPARAAFRPADFEHRIEKMLEAFRADRRDAGTPDDPLGSRRMAAIAAAIERSAVAVQSPLQRIEHRLAPWVTFVVIPIFALSNAGIDLLAVSWREAPTNRVTLGVVAGLVLGKFAGVSLFSWIAVVCGLARLPSGVGWKHLLGAAWLAGIGFTMSLFIAELAFGNAVAAEHAKLGILLGSAISSVIGLVWLYCVGSGARPGPDQAPETSSH
jgi:NhaA family Na+:H+ antiporter